MNLLKVSLFFVLVLPLLSCGKQNSHPYIESLAELGWQYNNEDSLTVLFTTINQCSPCNQEIRAFNSNYSKNVLLVVNERFKSNYDSYLKANSIIINSIQDESGIFRKQDLIPFLPYKIRIYKNDVFDLGELGR